MKGWNGKEELEGGVERKDRGGKGEAGVKNEEGEERHGCWVIDAPGESATRKKILRLIHS